MIVTRPREIGANRPPCEHKVRVARGLVTICAQRRAHEAKRRGMPIDQCAQRSEFIVDGRPLCRHHAGDVALRHLMEAPGEHS